ncbi:MAG: phosphatase PAP2 family protein [Thermodesulfovibrionia bacterium]
MELKRAIRAVDILTFSFLSFLLTISIININGIPNAGILILIYSALMGVLSLLIYLRMRNDGALLRMTNDIIFPVIVVFLIFDSLSGLIQYINPSTYDHLLIRIDYLILRCYPTVVLERLANPLITETMQFAYISYYPLPLVLGIALKIKDKEREFDISLFLIILCFFISYIGYILVPAIGPRYTMYHLQGIDLNGVLFRDEIDRVLNALEGIKRDAFPSGHSGIALLILYLSYRFNKGLFYVLLPIVLALLFSTVYLRYHYVVDVIGGILLFLITIVIGERLYLCWERMRSGEKG